MLADFLAIFTRISGFFLVSPLFSSRKIPIALRFGLAVAFTLVLAPSFLSTHAPTPYPLPMLFLNLVKEGLIGYLLGFILGALSIRAATGVTDTVFVAVPIVALGFPILDTGLAFVRRALDHRHPLIGDEQHIHHRLEETGFGPRGLLMVVYGIAVLFSAARAALSLRRPFVCILPKDFR